MKLFLQFKTSLEILVEVDHLQAAQSPYLQIKGANKEVVMAAATILGLDGSYTTKTFLQIILESLPSSERSSNGIHCQQVARLQELVEFIQSQGGSFSIESSPSREILPLDSAIEDLQYRIKKLERWYTIDLVLWTFVLSALIGYSLYKRGRH